MSYAYSSFDSDSDGNDFFDFDHTTIARSAPTVQWLFSSSSNSSAEIFCNLPKRESRETFKLSYNATDKVLLKKATVEITHSLSHARISLFGYDASQPIYSMISFASAMLKSFLGICSQCIGSGINVAAGGSLSPQRSLPRRTVSVRVTPVVKFHDIVAFLCCHFIMRVLNISATELI